MRISMSGRSTLTLRRGSTKRRILTAAAILQIAGGFPCPALAHDGPRVEEFSQLRMASQKKSALEILKSMINDQPTLKSGRQAWIPGGYLGLSKNWG